MKWEWSSCQSAGSSKNRLFWTGSEWIILKECKHQTTLHGPLSYCESLIFFAQVPTFGNTCITTFDLLCHSFWMKNICRLTRKILFRERNVGDEFWRRILETNLGDEFWTRILDSFWRCNWGVKFPTNGPAKFCARFPDGNSKGQFRPCLVAYQKIHLENSPPNPHCNFTCWNGTQIQLLRAPCCWGERWPSKFKSGEMDWAMRAVCSMGTHPCKGMPTWEWHSWWAAFDCCLWSPKMWSNLDNYPRSE